jgi:protein translocase SecG subunit
MKTVIVVVQIVTAILIVISIVLQQKGTGLSGVFGGSSNYYQTRRGAEKFMFYVTVFSAFLFFLATMWQVFAK